ncbi:hypothetical protein [Cetobacterium somerae]
MNLILTKLKNMDEQNIFEIKKREMVLSQVFKHNFINYATCF